MIVLLCFYTTLLTVSVTDSLITMRSPDLQNQLIPVTPGTNHRIGLDEVQYWTAALLPRRVTKTVIAVNPNRDLVFAIGKCSLNESIVTKEQVKKPVRKL